MKKIFAAILCVAMMCSFCASSYADIPDSAVWIWTETESEAIGETFEKLYGNKNENFFIWVVCDGCVKACKSIYVIIDVNDIENIDSVIDAMPDKTIYVNYDSKNNALVLLNPEYMYLITNIDSSYVANSMIELMGEMFEAIGISLVKLS